MLFYEISPYMRGTLYRDKRQLWVMCYLRKARRCQKCGRLIPAKGNAYRPITNADNRMWRLHEECMTLVEYAEPTER